MASVSAAGAASVAAAAAAARICYNVHCKDPKAEPPARRKGWRLRSGEVAELCDRCCSAYEQGTFCETFHSKDHGWRNCETCRKRLHCGCVVSVHTYVLLDAGGVDCVACARKSLITTPNQMFLPSQAPERAKEVPAKSWSQMSSPYPGQWRQVPRIWNLASSQSELQRRISYEFERPNGAEKLFSGMRSPISAQDKKTETLAEKAASSSANHAVRGRHTNGNTGLDSISALNGSHKEDVIADIMQDSSHLAGEIDPMSGKKGVLPVAASSSGVSVEAYHTSRVTTSLQPSIAKDESSSPLLGLAASYPLPLDPNDSSRASTSQLNGQTIPPPLAKQFYPQNVGETSTEFQAQVRNGRPKMDIRGRNSLLSRYLPRITDQELQQISGDSNSVVTPLFEKILSASDAGRIGRLVLPKKCAEAYFPSISQPEGLPLKVQDARGKDWVFQFRFWPNNNSRMYVLEGVTPCIQSMQLQAGDTVTFSRLDPEGKLLMGFRKTLQEQEGQAVKGGNCPSDVNNQSSTPTESVTTTPRPLNTQAKSPTNAEDLAAGTKATFIQKDGSTRPSPSSNKRKGSALGSKSKRLRIENEDSVELKLTWEEAQELLRPPPNQKCSVVVIEGNEIEEYEEAPVLGKPTLFVTNQSGENHQWVQCEDCFKWRKLPTDALLPFRWTCSNNKWDHERSSCQSPEELTKEQLADLLPATSGASRRCKAKVENGTVEVSDGLDTLANLAILGEAEALPSSSQPTTKHPRHRPGCSCIVCIQPPSGKGPKHKQTCTCNVCLTVKRRFRTLMLRRERRQSEKEAETARKQQHQLQQLVQSPDILAQGGSDFALAAGNIFSGAPQNGMSMITNDGVVIEESERKNSTTSPIKAPRIDLNIQPEREEDTGQPRSLIITSNSVTWLPRVETKREAAE